MNGLSIFSNDVKYAIRRLIKSPGFAVVVILLLAFGVGTNVTIFSMLNALKLRSIPVPKPDELHVLEWEGSSLASADNNFLWMLPNGDFAGDLFTYQNYCLFRDEVGNTAQITAMKGLWWPKIQVNGQQCKGGAMWVSGNFFDGLKLNALLGRTLRPDDDSPNAAPAAVISHSFWKSNFGGDPKTLGQSVTVKDNAFTIVGVLPKDFVSPEIGQMHDVYIPVNSQSQIEPVTIMVRIASGHEQKVREQCEALFQRVIFSKTKGDKDKKVSLVFEDGARGRYRYTRYKSKPLQVLIPIGIIILIVIVTNLTGLQLARCASHQHELAIRGALGAGRWRLMRQLLTESFLLVFIGTALGLILASWCKIAIAKMIWIHITGYDFGNDGLVLGFTLLISVLTMLFFGALPALRSVRFNPLDGLREKTTTGRIPLRLGKGLVIAQVGLAFLLLTGAGLFIRTSHKLTHVDKGFDTKNLLTFKLDPKLSGYQGDQLTNINDLIATTIEALPGVKAVTRSEHFLITGGGGMFGNARRKVVGTSYFSTMKIPLLRGRDFETSDEDGDRKVIINELLAKELFPNEDPIGKYLPLPQNLVEFQGQVVGVCRDFKCFDVRRDLEPAMFYHSKSNKLLCYAVRTTTPPSTMIPVIRKVVADIDSAVSIEPIMTQEDRIHSMFIREQRLGQVACVAAFVAASLLCLGLYGLQAYLVTHRTREIGVRLALGATKRQVVMPILRRSGILGIFGVLWGIPAALASLGVIRGYVWGVKLFDPVTLATAGTLIFIISLIATYIPARQAARIDPMEALRYE